jgi:hypothetical protein
MKNGCFMPINRDVCKNMNGKIRLLCLAVACACLFCSGCAKGQYHSRTKIPAPSSSMAGAGATTAARPAPPAGMTLGQAYVSALNENCYEVFSNTRPPQTYAMCYRQGAWALSPGIFMSVPQSQTAPSLEPASANMRPGS